MLTLACAQRPGQLAEGPGPVLDVDDQNIALVGDSHPRILERAAGRARLLVVHEDVDDPPSPSPVNAHIPRMLTPTAPVASPSRASSPGPILQDYGQIPRHLASGAGVYQQRGSGRRCAARAWR